MNKRIMEIEKRRITIFSEDDASRGAIIYLHIASADMEQLVKKLDGVVAVLVAIDQVDWNRELSPWPAKRAFRGSEDFGGGADAYLKELTETIVPAVEAELRFVPSGRILAGYSLAVCLPCMPSTARIFLPGLGPYPARSGTMVFSNLC